MQSIYWQAASTVESFVEIFLRTERGAHRLSHHHLRYPTVAKHKREQRMSLRKYNGPVKASAPQWTPILWICAKVPLGLGACNMELTDKHLVSSVKTCATGFLSCSPVSRPGSHLFPPSLPPPLAFGFRKPSET